MSKPTMTAVRVRQYAESVGNADACTGFGIGLDTLLRWKDGFKIPATKLPLVERVVAAWERKAGKGVRA